ncbi:MAG: alpha/beta fold hydrolase [Candidatus Limnocylindrales bacterium]
MSTRRIAWMGAPLVALSAGTIAAAGGSLMRRYQRDLQAAQSRLSAVDRTRIATAFGDIEYTERGTGEPLLVSHGIFQGCESALLFRGLVPGRRIIAPSRFGYLGSDIPPGSTPADQADAFTALLDALGIAQIDVVGVSAGTTSVVQLALRHPDRVKHLVILSGNLPGSRTAVVQPSWARMVNRQVPLWLIKTFLPSTMAFLSGVPRRLPMTDADVRFVAEFIDSLFPITPRVQGVDFDAFVSNADVNNYNLKAIMAPTLIVHTEDDPLVSYEAAERAAGRIPGARLVRLKTGGHLLLGQSGAIQRELASFLGPRVE